MLAGWQVFLTGAVLGVSIAAPPGPVNAAAAYQVTRSWLSGWLTLLGATTADGVFFLLTYFGVTAVIASGQVRELLFTFGGALMLYLAYSTLRKARHRPSASAPSSSRFPYLLGLTIGLTSPFQLAWWIAVGAGMVTTFGLSIIAGFFTGIVAWTLFFSALLHEGISRYSRVYPAMIYVSGALLLGFGLWFLYAAVTALL
jgi:threonine/homoserine/homoserine lactone efflux protein